MSNTMRRVLVTLGIVSLLVLTLVLGACGDPAPRPLPVPVVCATWQDREGNWREPGDRELVDDDPCDLDDVFEVRTTAPPAKPSTKPAVKPSPRKSGR